MDRRKVREFNRKARAQAAKRVSQKFEVGDRISVSYPDGVKTAVVREVHPTWLAVGSERTGCYAEIPGADLQFVTKIDRCPEPFRVGDRWEQFGQVFEVTAVVGDLVTSHSPVIGWAIYPAAYLRRETMPVARPKQVIQRDLFGKITSVQTLAPNPTINQLALF